MMRRRRDRLKKMRTPDRSPRRYQTMRALRLGKAQAAIRMDAARGGGVVSVPLMRSYAGGF
jgi:hypothetical protein